MKFHIFTFGCQMNVCDSDWLCRSLTAMGFEQGAEEEADLFLINTCSVREKPEQKIYSLLGRLTSYWKKNKDVFVGVGGCVAQQVGKKFFQRFPHVRLVFGTDGIAMVPQTILRLISEPELRVSLLDFEDYYPERENNWPEKMPAQAYVNIMQGCDNFCAYCIVPYTRGRQKSRSSKAILDECRTLVNLGVKEITLLGQNVNSYGLDKFGDGVSFAELLYQVAAIDGLKRLRFTTSHPKDIADEVIKAFGELSCLCPQLHLPLQSGSNRILKLMGRKYTREEYLDIVDKLRKVCPDIALTTDLIVGFPGETEEDFEQTLEMIELVRFENSFSFKYSDRPGVRAEKMQPKVLEEVKVRRLAVLQELQEKLTGESYAGRVGKIDEVLVEGLSKKQGKDMKFWRGRDSGGRVVNVPCSSDRDLTGEIVRVKIVEAKKHSLLGEWVDE
ncbi:tRNA (N6-isopentenyl adenosine(37)-C2)-methylthiotransferase MiaB [Desulfovulcanus ferrireducens]|uniref:tRNA (N6-isopentenyl adenosine(37)-C2)-methylthiotransferase MiaB n=1 Tax=Desulfovulcanus ferrireducens TaxID=2831190 RepID=UPI00207B9DBD|nr:tRNA (N6-isopentenyl adenosine(37)-C2)-methylthiotransferase MiaB [Desulfovulcanus ferrireducens]